MRKQAEFIGVLNRWNVIMLLSLLLYHLRLHKQEKTVLNGQMGSFFSVMYSYIYLQIYFVQILYVSKRLFELCVHLNFMEKGDFIWIKISSMVSFPSIFSLFITNVSNHNNKKFLLLHFSINYILYKCTIFEHFI